MHYSTKYNKLLDCNLIWVRKSNVMNYTNKMFNLLKQFITIISQCME